MHSRGTYDHFGDAFFLTFSCYRRRRLLDDNTAKRIVMGLLALELRRHKGVCSGFVIMPDHVHAMIWFPEPEQLSSFMKLWKQRSSFQIKKNLKRNLSNYALKMPLNDPIWQPGYYSFNVYSQQKLNEKINYMHSNPVKAGLVSRPEDWQFSSARYYLFGKSVGVPIAMPG